MFTTLPMVEAIQQELGFYGVSAIQTTGSDPRSYNFSRVSATPDVLATSFGQLKRRLGANSIAVPNKFMTDAYDQLINPALGDGFVGGALNPNPPGMGLVTDNRGLALATPWSDAPAWVTFYLNPVNPEVRVISSGTGIWNILKHGTVQQTVDQIQSKVESRGGKFDIRYLWVSTSPGARATGEWPFLLDAGGVSQLPSVRSFDDASLDYNPIVQVGKLTDERPYALDLSGLVRQLWLETGMNERRLFFNKKTNAEVSPHASKRIADTKGEKAASEAFAISLG